MKLLHVAAAVFILNLPFGYWRSHVPTRSRPWFLAIHLPVPFVVALRVFSGLGWQLASFPVLVGAFFLGQYVGGKWSSWKLRKVHHPVAGKSAVERQALSRRASRGTNYVKTVAE